MEQENHQLVTRHELKQELNIFKEDITKQFTSQFKELKDFMMEGFSITYQKIDHIEKRLDERIDNVDQKLDRISAQHDRRLSIIEDRAHIVKNVIEKGLNTKVGW